MFTKTINAVKAFLSPAKDVEQTTVEPEDLLEKTNSLIETLAKERHRQEVEMIKYLNDCRKNGNRGVSTELIKTLLTPSSQMVYGENTTPQAIRLRYGFYAPYKEKALHDAMLSYCLTAGTMRTCAIFDHSNVAEAYDNAMFDIGPDDDAFRKNIVNVILGNPKLVENTRHFIYFHVIKSDRRISEIYADYMLVCFNPYDKVYYHSLSVRDEQKDLLDGGRRGIFPAIMNNRINASLVYNQSYILKEKQEYDIVGKVEMDLLELEKANIKLSGGWDEF